VQLAANTLWRKLLRRAGGHVERFACISGHARDLALERFPEWRDRVVVAPPGLPDGWLSAFSDPRPVMQGERVRLLTVARLHPRKGQLDVVRSLLDIPRDNRPPLGYTIVGTGRSKKYRDCLRREAAICPHPVQLAGERSGRDLRRAFAEADIFVMASRSDPASVESFGIVYLEAAAAGLPIIAADVGGVREAVEAGKTAMLVPPGNPEALRGAIRQLAANPQQRRLMGEAGRRFAASFSWERSARRVLEG
jgi:glycosyltransferase involved in cell wall biosynthesis